MPNIGFRASSSIESSSATNLIVTKPTGTTDGDIVILVATVNGTDTLTDGNGATPFTSNYSATIGGAGFRVAIFSRRIQSGDPTTYRINGGGATRMALVALTFQNPDAAAIFDVTPSSSTHTQEVSSDGASINSVNVASTRFGCIHIITAHREISGADGYDSNLSGYTREITTVGSAPDISVYYKILGAAGNAGAQTVTASSGGNGTSVAQSFILINSAATIFTLDPGSYAVSGQIVDFRSGSLMYLRHSK